MATAKVHRVPAGTVTQPATKEAPVPVESYPGEGIHCVVEGDKLTITIDLAKDFGLSASGKSTIIASSKGNVQILGAKNGAKMGLNIYR